jgi:hypothetical protein
MKQYRLLTWSNTQATGQGFTEQRINDLAKEGWRVISSSGAPCSDLDKEGFVFVWTLEKDL